MSECLKTVEEVFVGLDVSKRTLDVNVLPKDVSFSFDNSEQGRKELYEQLATLAPKLVVLEPTGGYERDVVDVLLEGKMPVVVINAKQARDFARAVGKLAKTDQVDAYCLALFAEKIRPEVRELPDAESRALQALMVRRRQL